MTSPSKIPKQRDKKCFARKRRNSAAVKFFCVTKNGTSKAYSDVAEHMGVYQELVIFPK